MSDALRWGVRALFAYGLFVAAMWAGQRHLMYVPSGGPVSPATVGLGADVIDAPTRDGERVRLWWLAPQPGRAVVVHFHGNGGNQSLWADVFRDLHAAGFGVMSLSYRGYAGSSGQPSEAGLIEDGRTALAEARRRAPDAPLVLFGDSMGTGVATAVASGEPVAGLVLNAPYTAVEDVAAETWWFLPVRLLIADRFLSRERIGAVRVPVLILHGTADEVIPFAHGERLFQRASEPKRFVRIEGGRHTDLWRRGGREAVLSFLGGIGPP